MLIDDPLQEGNIWSGGKSIFLSQSFTISWITEHWEDMKQAINHPLRKVHISALGFGIRFLSAFPFLLVSVPHLSRRNCSCYSVCNASKCCQSDAVGTCDPICSIREVHFPGPTVSARDTWSKAPNQETGLKAGRLLNMNTGLGKRVKLRALHSYFVCINSKNLKNRAQQSRKVPWGCGWPLDLVRNEIYLVLWLHEPLNLPISGSS